MESYLLLKPYFKNHLDTLHEGLMKYNLQIKSVYRVDNWKELSLLIYKTTVEKEGDKFEVGLYGHLELVKYLFGNKALLVTFKDTLNSNTEKTYLDVLKLKKYIRTTLRGGPNHGDLIVCMNLDKIEVPKSEILQTRGKLGVFSEKENFTEFIDIPGLWDYYYFKYVHVPDTFSECMKEYNMISDFGILKKENEISADNFYQMIKLRTYTEPEDFNHIKK